MDQRRPTLYSSSDPELGNIEEQEEPESVFETAGTARTMASTARPLGKTDTKIPVKTKAGRTNSIISEGPGGVFEPAGTAGTMTTAGTGVVATGANKGRSDTNRVPNGLENHGKPGK